MIRLISDFEENGVSSGITVQCDARCTVLNSVDWELRMRELKQCIIFIDETATFLKTKRFAEAVRGSDNYFVIVTRDDLPQLPYSIEEIYGLRNVSDTEKYKTFRKVYNEMYNLYNLKLPKKVVPDKVIVEDSNAGFSFFKIVFGKMCESARGKSNVYSLLRKSNPGLVLTVVDGAAFGSEIGKLDRYLRACGSNNVIYAPESFEYLILNSGLVDVPGTITGETYKYADSTKYMSWEEFYTSYLIRVSADSVYRYSKNRLGSAYKTEGAIKRIIKVLPEQIRPQALTEGDQTKN